MKATTLALGLYLGTGLPAHAQTAQFLYKACMMPDPPAISYCAGFIEGVLDAQAMLTSRCPARGHTRKQNVEAFIKAVQRNPNPNLGSEWAVITVSRELSPMFLTSCGEPSPDKPEDTLIRPSTRR
jgi:Rap1a immunity proteins